MSRTTFATAINCIDGRVHMPVTEWMRERLLVAYVDLITYPGVDGLLALQPVVAQQLVRPPVELSVGRHASEVVAITAHHDCLGNPVSQELHREHLRQALREVASWNLGVKLIALWVDHASSIEVVKTRGADAAVGAADLDG